MSWKLATVYFLAKCRVLPQHCGVTACSCCSRRDEASLKHFGHQSEHLLFHLELVAEAVFLEGILPFKRAGKSRLILLSANLAS